MNQLFNTFTDVAVSGLAAPFLASFLAATVALWVCSIPYRRMPPDAHWSLVALNYWPIRRTRFIVLFWILSIASFANLDVDKQWEVEVRILVLVSVLCGCLVGSRVGLLRLNLPKSTSDGKLRYIPAGLLLRPLLPSMLLLLGLTHHHCIGRSSILTAGIILLVNVALYLGGSIEILKWLGLLRPIGGRIEEISRDTAAKEDATLRSVMIMNLGLANAFAAPWTRDILITDTALVVLNEEELQSVIAHEVGHLKESRATSAKRLAILPAFIAIGLAPAAIIGGHAEIALAMFAGFIVLSKWTNRHHKSLEIDADKVANQSQSAEGIYARALEKLHIASLIPAVLDPRSPYPSLYDRMESAGITPDFNRLPPPDRYISLVVGASAALLFLFLWTFFPSVVNGFF